MILLYAFSYSKSILLFIIACLSCCFLSPKLIPFYILSGQVLGCNLLREIIELATGVVITLLVMFRVGLSLIEVSFHLVFIFTFYYIYKLLNSNWLRLFDRTSPVLYFKIPPTVVRLEGFIIYQPVPKDEYFV